MKPARKNCGRSVVAGISDPPDLARYRWLRRCHLHWFGLRWRTIVAKVIKIWQMFTKSEKIWQLWILSWFSTKYCQLLASAKLKAVTGNVEFWQFSSFGVLWVPTSKRFQVSPNLSKFSKDRIAQNNNILKKSTNFMKFSENDQINFTKPPVSSQRIPEQNYKITENKWNMVICFKFLEIKFRYFGSDWRFLYSRVVSLNNYVCFAATYARRELQIHRK